jgi:TolB protein
MTASWIFLAVALMVQQPDTRITVTRDQHRVIAIPEFAGAVAPFHVTLWADIEESGLFEMRSPSFYPKQPPSQPAAFQPADWQGVDYVAIGYTSMLDSKLVLSGWALDAHTGAQILGNRYVASNDAAGLRRAAHEFAADIIRRFGGKPMYGSRIYFRSNRSGADEIWSIDTDGSDPRQITRVKGLVMTPGVSPDGTRIAFTSDAEFPQKLFVYTTDPPRRIPFENPAASLTTTPEFTPDGRRMVFASSATKDGCCGLFIADLDGKNRRLIASSHGADTEPKVNPKNPNEIAFVSDRGGLPQIYRMNLDGLDVERLTNGQGEAANPSWSPDGVHLAFAWTAGFAPGNWNIFVMDTVKREPVQLTHGEGRNENPVWAPDGVHLAFTSTRSGSEQIWIMLADGSRPPRQLTHEGRNRSPAWSR